jgi:hypothetical protein
MNNSTVLQSIVDSNNNTWLQIGDFVTFLNDVLGVFYCVNIASGPSTVNVNFSGAGALLTLAIAEFPNSSQTPLDVFQKATPTVSLTPNVNISPSLENEMIIFCAFRYEGGSNWTPGAGYSLMWSGANEYLMAEYNLSVPQGNQNAGMSFSGPGGSWAGLAASFTSSGLLASYISNQESFGSDSMSPSYGNIV